MSTRAKCLVILFVLMVIDILPIPVIGLISLHIILNRPPWFRETVRRLYREGEK